MFLFSDFVIFISWLAGVSNPRSLLFSAGIAFTLLILLEHSLTVTKLWRQDKDLAQDQAMLERRVRQLEAALEEDDASASSEPGIPSTQNTQTDREGHEDSVHEPS
jgi:hypothetical protein